MQPNRDNQKKFCSQGREKLKITFKEKNFFTSGPGCTLCYFVSVFLRALSKKKTPQFIPEPEVKKHMAGSEEDVQFVEETLVVSSIPDLV